MDQLVRLDLTSTCGNMTREYHMIDPHPDLVVLKQVFSVNANEFKPTQDPILTQVGLTSGHEIFEGEDGKFYYLSHLASKEEFFLNFRFLVCYQIPAYKEPHKFRISSQTVYAMDDLNVLVEHEEIDRSVQMPIKNPKSFTLLLEDHERLVFAPFAQSYLKQNPNYTRPTMNQIRDRQIERNRLLEEKKHKHEELLCLYKKANEVFDGSLLIPHLAKDIIFQSQLSPDMIKGRVAVGRYLILRMKFWKKMSGVSRHYQKGYWGKVNPIPCLILSSREGNEGLIYFTINQDDEIAAIDILNFNPPYEQVEEVESFDHEKVH